MPSVAATVKAAENLEIGSLDRNPAFPVLVCPSDPESGAFQVLDHKKKSCTSSTRGRTIRRQLETPLKERSFLDLVERLRLWPGRRPWLFSGERRLRLLFDRKNISGYLLAPAQEKRARKEARNQMAEPSLGGRQKEVRS